MSRQRVLALDAATYRPHALHGDGRAWVEKNCYVDIWIEVLHAHGLDPAAMLAFTLAVDFEGDQWTFFKPVHDELRALYGVDVQEMTVWRPLVQHIVHHLGEGKLVSTEADAFYLPDTKGTDYRTQHTKTTIVAQDIDLGARRLGYFHNAGYHEVAGDDFAALFRLNAAPDPTYMPFFAELIRVDRVVRPPAAELAAAAAALLEKHVARRPATNPIARFARRLADELPELQAQGLGHYHAWAFATVRQLGSAFELAAYFLRWLEAQSAARGLEPAAAACDQISTAAKTLILKGARAVNARKPTDFGPILDPAVAAWDTAMDLLARRS